MTTIYTKYQPKYDQHVGTVRDALLYLDFEGESTKEALKLMTKSPKHAANAWNIACGLAKFSDRDSSKQLYLEEVRQFPRDADYISNGLVFLNNHRLSSAANKQAVLKLRGVLSNDQRNTLASFFYGSQQWRYPHEMMQTILGTIISHPKHAASTAKLLNKLHYYDVLNSETSAIVAQRPELAQSIYDTLSTEQYLRQGIKQDDVAKVVQQETGLVRPKDQDPAAVKTILQILHGLVMNESNLLPRKAQGGYGMFRIREPRLTKPVRKMQEVVRQWNPNSNAETNKAVLSQLREIIEAELPNGPVSKVGSGACYRTAHFFTDCLHVANNRFEQINPIFQEEIDKLGTGSVADLPSVR